MNNQLECTECGLKHTQSERVSTGMDLFGTVRYVCPACGAEGVAEVES